MRLFFFSLLLVIISLSYAAVYMKKDQNNNVSYSDMPFTPQSQAIDIPEVNTTTTPIASEEQSSAPAEKGTGTDQKSPETTQAKPLEKKPYTEFVITSPKDQDTLPNQPVIGVDVKVQPPLQAGDKIVMLVDGSVVGAPQTSTHFGLSILERGTHQLSARLIDTNGQILKQTNPITIYIHRNSSLTSPAMQPPPPPPRT